MPSIRRFILFFAIVSAIVSLCVGFATESPIGYHLNSKTIIQGAVLFRSEQKGAKLDKSDRMHVNSREKQRPPQQSALVEKIGSVVQLHIAAESSSHQDMLSDTIVFLGEFWTYFVPLLFYYNVVGLAVAIWWRHRRQMEATITNAVQVDELFNQYGYRSVRIGTFLKCACFMAVVLQFSALILTILANVLDAVYSEANAQHRENRTHFFIFMWFQFLFTMAIVKANAGRLSTLFLLPVSNLCNAEFVGVPRAINSEDLEIFKISRTEHCFFRNCMRWVYSDESKRFILPDRVAIPHPCLSDQGALLSIEECRGLRTSDVDARLESFGRNEVIVDVPTFWEAFGQELTSWGSFYQTSMGLVFFYRANVPAVAVILLALLASSILRARIIKNNTQRMSQMAGLTAPVLVKRDSKWVIQSSVGVVPGDMIAVEEGKVLLADIVLIHGMVCLDESALTGETMPVQKFAATPSEDMALSGAKHSLSAGTQVVVSGVMDASPSHLCAPQNIGVVVATGAHTSRGELIRDILKPSAISQKYHTEIWPALFVGSIFLFLLLFVQVYYSDSGSIGMDILVGIGTVSQFISPLLPAALLWSEAVACGRLQEKSIYCLSPSLVTMAGRIRVWCFDKTGTLTQEGLQLIGVHETFSSIDDVAPTFGPISDLALGARYSLIAEMGLSAKPDQRRLSMLGATDNSLSSISKPMQIAMATCHTITYAAGEPVGNPAEVEMFRRSGWALDVACEGGKRTQDDDQIRMVRNPASEQRCKVIRCFEFDHNTMTSSVVVSYEGNYSVFCKGAYEQIQQRLLPGSQPADYLRISEMHAKRGCYVLAMAQKPLPSAVVAHNMSRQEAENGLKLLGLMLFRNEPKKDSVEAIQKLRKGDNRMVILTGDNVLTGIHVARKVKLCHPTKPFRLARLDEKGELIWTDPDSQTPEAPVGQPSGLVVGTQSINEVPRGNFALQEALKEYDEELAITGAALDLIGRQHPQLLENLLFRIRVFGRVRPRQKVEVVQSYMQRGLITGMCGDGGNDCGALKAAHVGVALSEAEASIVSPFSAGSKSVECCEMLLREGCASLDNTFALLRFMISCGLTYTLAKASLLIESLAILPGMPFVFFDCLTAASIYFITHCRPANELTKHRPIRSLFDMSFVGHLLIVLCANSLSLFVAWWIIGFSGERFDGRNLHDPVTNEKIGFSMWWKLLDSREGNILWIWLTSVYVGATTAACQGGMFRAPVYHNWWLCFVFVPLATLLPMLCLWTGPSFIACLFRTNCDSAGIKSAGTHWISLLDKGFWETGFYAPHGSNVLTGVGRSGTTVLFCCTLVLHNSIQLVMRLYQFGLPTASSRSMQNLQRTPSASSIDQMRVDSLPTDSD